MTLVQMTQLGKIWIPMGFLVIREVVNSLPFTALKCSSDWIQESGETNCWNGPLEFGRQDVKFDGRNRNCSV